MADIEVYQTRPLGYWSTLPSIKTWGGVSRSVSYCYWGSWRCQELSSRHQRVCFYPQMVKNGKTNNQLWKIAKLKKITFWSAFFGLVGLNWGCCSKIIEGWGVRCAKPPIFAPTIMPVLGRPRHSEKMICSKFQPLATTISFVRATM